MKIYRIFDLIMIGILLVCGLSITEFILMRMNINMTNEEAAKRLGVPFDRRSTLQVVSDLRKEGKNTYPQIVSHSFEGRDIHPIGSISNVLTVVSNESGKYLIFESDEHGFRNPKGMYDSEIVIIGDSFAQGHSAETDVATIMREKYPAVLNLGMGSSGFIERICNLTGICEAAQNRLLVLLRAE